MSDVPPMIPAPDLDVAPDAAGPRTAAFVDDLVRRRTVRDFADTPIPDGVLEDAIRAAASAPSGAHVQPWRLVIVADPEVRRQLREGAEAKEREFYDRRASDEWLAALRVLGTDADKPFLTDAPALIAVFEVHRGPHSSSPMKFLNQILDRPAEERGFLLVPVGYPAARAQVPAIERKPLSEVLVRR